MAVSDDLQELDHSPEGREPPPVMGHRLDPSMPLHKFVCRRMSKGRDAKILITAKNSETGTGKTTLAGFLALSWTPLFAGKQWTCERGGTLRPQKYLEQYQDLPTGYALIMDEAEQLDARRSMASENVDFSHDWMMMRVRQIISILTLPTTSALDSRLMELADVWIEVQRRGKAHVHAINVNSYGGGNVYTPRVHAMSWPDVFEHPELEALGELKQKRIEGELEALAGEEEDPDPEEVERETKVEHAQRLRDMGVPILSQDDDQPDIVSAVDMSQSWISKNTEARD